MKRWPPALLVVALAGAVWAWFAVQPRAAGPRAAAAPAALEAFASDAAVADAADWRARRAPILRAAFEREIYGEVPDLGAAGVEARAPLAIPEIEGIGRAEQWRVALGEGGEGRVFNMVVIAPDTPGPHPLVIMQVFCGARAAMPGRPEAVAAPLTPVLFVCDNAAFDPLVSWVFGRWINGPPVARVVERGYALAIFYPGDVVADDNTIAPAALARIGGDPRAGALAVWASLYARAYDLLAADPRFDARRIAIWGHSRHGKAALLAGAVDARFAAVIAHQSGRFGASLTRSHRGERPDQILKDYAHWFTPGLAPDAALSVDQHLLIALNAPRPVFLGNGASDDWSDQTGAWRAAEGAHPVYALFGSAGLDQPDADHFNPAADIAFFTRPGGHGVTTRDWDAFLDFLDAHLRSNRPS